MSDQFPMFRLGTLLARQLSAPIATRIKVYARTHPRFSRTVCMGTGRLFYACELRCRMWTLALRQPRKVPPISDQAALNSGSDLLGEAIVFGLGGLIIIFEVNRQANKQEGKVLDEKSQWLAVMVSLEELQRELVLQQQDIDRLQATLRRLASPSAPSAPVPSEPIPSEPVPSTSPDTPDKSFPFPPPKSPSSPSLGPEARSPPSFAPPPKTRSPPSVLPSPESRSPPSCIPSPEAK